MADMFVPPAADCRHEDAATRGETEENELTPLPVVGARPRLPESDAHGDEPRHGARQGRPQHMLIMVVVLIVKPTGIMGKRTSE